MVGRKEELLALERAMRSDESQFVAVYGRRRVGKTYLVREALGREFIFEHVGPYDGSYEEELDAFRDSLVKWGVQDCPQIKTWKEAFLLLEKFVAASRKRRKVIFIDELSWMDTPKSFRAGALLECLCFCAERRRPCRLRFGGELDAEENRVRAGI